jgi:hypothetical protein
MKDEQAWTAFVLSLARRNMLQALRSAARIARLGAMKNRT